MKKFLVLLLCIGLIMGSTTPVKADNSANVSTEVKKILNDYINNRQMSFFDGTISISENALSSKVLADENLRKTKIKDLEKKLNIEVISAKSTYDIKDVRYVDKNVHISLYEWTFFDYLGEKGLIDTSGYGVDHDILVSLDENKKAKLLEDSYDEGPLTDMYSSSYKKNRIVDNDSSITESNNSQKIPQNNENTPSSLAGYYATYNPDYAAGYANSWVSSLANGTNMEQHYNSAYINFNPLGGDCANFVSQSINKGGGLPMIGLATHSNTFPAWWYDKKGTSTTTDDTYTTTWAWTGADAQRNFMANYYGVANDSPTDNTIKRGDPVYIDWNYSSGARYYNHATICVGKDSNGVPIVNCHNNDYYHVRWNYGYSDSAYSVVNMRLSSYVNP